MQSDLDKYWLLSIKKDYIALASTPPHQQNLLSQPQAHNHTADCLMLTATA